MNQETIFAIVVGILVPFLGMLFKAYAFGDPVKLWIELGASVVGAIVVLVVSGQLFATPLPTEPIAFLQALVPILTLVVSVAVLVYTALQEKLNAGVATIKASR